MLFPTFVCGRSEVVTPRAIGMGFPAKLALLEQRGRRCCRLHILGIYAMGSRFPSVAARRCVRPPSGMPHDLDVAYRTVQPCSERRVGGSGGLLPAVGRRSKMGRTSSLVRAYNAASFAEPRPVVLGLRAPWDGARTAKQAFLAELIQAERHDCGKRRMLV